MSTTQMDPAPAQSDDADIRALLRNSLDTVLARHYSFEQRRDARENEARESQAAWAAYAELGLLALTLPAGHGGLPVSLADLAMVVEAMGGAMVLEPYAPAMVAARLLSAAGSEDQQAAWLPAICRGEVRVILAHEEANGGYAKPIAASATPDPHGWRLSGRKSAVAGGDTADLFIVSANTANGVALFLVPAADLAIRPARSFDWTGTADLMLDDVIIPTSARLTGGEAALAAALDEAAALACADAVGAIRAANALTRAHTSTRRQFGRSLDAFQVLQHRLVDMTIAQELAAPITAAAIAACAAATPAERARAVSAAKVKVGEAARYVGEQCVQLHGGMGLVQEYPAAHLFARLSLFELSHGGRDYHLERYAELVL
ncbi:MAG: acyl-CoA/acyl-ACP dehydrogenase [Alphaproteobacteria bacterium]|nr:acyl-CoA/acyl-ACP dehydrogenase [Alphaproteobacteria bacterium]MBU0794171.1 acyl-CoA/acyl-ACP dehydrogenase [Alphaproteobacteria bacterium]MBU0874745.1 acyl-CoA/acyl-ACP dehydrogenase [Alphaproteobacteria bacterium]MBU1768603.1 acyl-CoA/acyl-ACP dehydrogenase [Alphaproteobacteria bacterium]